MVAGRLVVRFWLRVAGFVVMGWVALGAIEAKQTDRLGNDINGHITVMGLGLLFAFGVLLWVIGSCIPEHLDEEPRYDEPPVE